MGTTVFETKDSVFFVGGRGTKAGNSNAGGCTLAAWEDAGLVNKNLAKVMDDNGEPFCNVIASVTDNGSGKVRITNVGDISIPCIGLIAHVFFDGLHVNGRYEVIAWNPIDWIDIDLAFVGNENCFVRVGGAFDTAQNAWNNTDASQYNVIIHSNKNQSKTDGNFTATWNLGTAGGSLADKSIKHFVGFDTQPGDEGQIGFDGEDDEDFSTDGGIRFGSAIESVSFENVIVEDAYTGWNARNDSVNSIRFIKCEGNSGTGYGWSLGYGKNFVLISCQGNHNSWYGFNLGYSSGGPNHLLVNCIAHDNTREGFRSIGSCYGSALLGCVAYNNGGSSYSGFSTNSYSGCGAMINCVAYNNGKHGFEFKRVNPVAINCIAKDNGQWGFYADTSGNLMVPHVAYCCAHGNSSGQYSLPGALPEQNSIEQDPQFVDAANGDFRPRNPAVLRGGKPDTSGNPTQMGAILQKYQFGDRERIANMARLRIIR